MKISVLCVLIAGVLPLISTAIAKWGFRDFDNHHPRDWLSRQTGFRSRANAAQLNAFEAFPFFAIAVVLGLVLSLDQAVLNRYCLVFVAARVLYLVAYLANWASLRTLCWLVAYASCFAIYLQLLV
ncbi:MAG: MAPEG family protein [Limnohabitans sp.]